MYILNKKIIHNERLTFSQMDYLDKRVENLIKWLKNKFPSLNITHEKSRQSESHYITLSDTKEYNWETISVRNHSNFTHSNYDRAFYLSEYENWLQLKKEIKNYIKEVFYEN